MTNKKDSINNFLLSINPKKVPIFIHKKQALFATKPDYVKMSLLKVQLVGCNCENDRETLVVTLRSICSLKGQSYGRMEDHSS